MRCSSCEWQLSAYLEGDLSLRRAAVVARHLRECPHCAALYVELKAVDGLLLTTKAHELPANFTRAVMAGVSIAPAPRAPKHPPLWGAVATYLVVAWVFALAWFFTDRSSAADLPHAVAHGTAGAWHALLAVTSLATHAAGAPLLAIAVLVAMILFADAIALAGIVFFYRSVRPKLAARLARPEAV